MTRMPSTALEFAPFTRSCSRWVSSILRRALWVFDAITDSEIVRVVDLGTLGWHRPPEMQLALVYLRALLVLYSSRSAILEDPLSGLFLDAQAGILVQHPGYRGERNPASCAISFNVAINTSLAASRVNR